MLASSRKLVKEALTKNMTKNTTKLPILQNYIYFETTLVIHLLYVFLYQIQFPQHAMKEWFHSQGVSWPEVNSNELLSKKWNLLNLALRESLFSMRHLETGTASAIEPSAGRQTNWSLFLERCGNGRLLVCTLVCWQAR